jgi:hypothetical protein
MLVSLKSNYIPEFQSTVFWDVMLAKKWQKEIHKDMRILTDDSTAVEAMIEETL